MWLLTIITSGFTWLRDYCKGFQDQGIWDRRLDFITTNILTTSFVLGVIPGLKAVKQFLYWLWCMLLGCFWPQKKINYFKRQEHYLAQKIFLLETKLERLKKKNQHHQHQMMLLTTKIKPPLETKAEPDV